MTSSLKMSEKYQKLSGKWSKLNDSGFEEFEAKNPGLATGKVGHNTNDIKLEYTMSTDGYLGSVSVDGNTQSCSFVYDGTLEHSIGGTKFSVTTRFIEGGRMPGGSLTTTYTASDGKEIKQQNYQFHGQNRMIIETIANGVGMVTVFEKE